MKRKKKVKRTTFKPDRRYIKDAVNEYLKNGGKIERLIPEPAKNTDLDDGDLEADLFLLANAESPNFNNGFGGEIGIF